MADEVVVKRASRRSDQPRPATLNTPRRFMVRLGLATGATLATLMGAQALLALEHANQPPMTNTDSQVSSLGQAMTPTLQGSPASGPARTQALLPAPPHVVIVVHNGGNSQVTALPGATGTALPNIQPPVPVVAAPPAAVAAAPQQPVAVAPAPAQPAPVTRSSHR